MKTGMSLIIRLVVSIGLCALLGGWLSPPRATARFSKEDEEKERMVSVRKALPAADRFERVGSGGFRYDVGYQGDSRVGAVFQVDGNGYGGPMLLVVGIDQEGKVVEVLLVAHNETPALWSKQTDQDFRAQFRGKTGPFILKKDEPSGNLDAVTSATISCRGIAGAVNEALRIFKKEWGRK